MSGTPRKRLCMSVIRDNVMLRPNELNDVVEICILRKLKERLSNTCTSRYGYVSNVMKVIEIHDNFISPTNATIIFDVTFVINAFQPKIGSVFDGIVDAIDVDVMMVAVRYDEEMIMGVVVTQWESSIRIGDTIKVRITDLKYENGRFNSIGIIEPVQMSAKSAKRTSKTNTTRVKSLTKTKKPTTKGSKGVVKRKSRTNDTCSEPDFDFKYVSSDSDEEGTSSFELEEDDSDEREGDEDDVNEDEGDVEIDFDEVDSDFEEPGSEFDPDCEYDSD